MTFKQITINCIIHKIIQEFFNSYSIVLPHKELEQNIDIHKKKIDYTLEEKNILFFHIKTEHVLAKGYIEENGYINIRVLQNLFKSN